MVSPKLTKNTILPFFECCDLILLWVYKHLKFIGLPENCIQHHVSEKFEHFFGGAELENVFEKSKHFTTYYW